VDRTANSDCLPVSHKIFSDVCNRLFLVENCQVIAALDFLDRCTWNQGAHLLDMRLFYHVIFCVEYSQARINVTQFLRTDPDVV